MKRRHSSYRFERVNNRDQTLNSYLEMQKLPLHIAHVSQKGLYILIKNYIDTMIDLITTISG